MTGGRPRTVSLEVALVTSGPMALLRSKRMPDRNARTLPRHRKRSRSHGRSLSTLGAVRSGSPGASLAPA